MVYRVAAIFIVLFWLTMTGLLVRKEAWPADSTLREIPVSHVVKLLFLHEQTSELNIVSEKFQLGHLRIQPRVNKETAARVIEFSGYVQLPIPGSARQRVAWNGEWEMEKTLGTRRFRLGVTMHDPEEVRAEVTIIPAANRAHYELRGTGGLIEQQDYSLDEAGLREVLRFLGVDQMLLPTMPIRDTPPTVKARQSSMIIHGEHIDTYLVTIEHNDQTLLEIHVSQLGQILQAKTILGYTLAPNDIAP
jgi:hypothetical protein